jgi:hypothetical protein
VSSNLLHTCYIFKQAFISGIASSHLPYQLCLRDLLHTYCIFKQVLISEIASSCPSHSLCLRVVLQTSCVFKACVVPTHVFKGFVTGFSGVYKICRWFGLSIVCTVCPELGGTHGLQVIITGIHAGKGFSPGNGVLRGEGTAKSTSSTNCRKLEKLIVF